MLATILTLTFGTMILGSLYTVISEMLREEEAPAVAVAPRRRRNRSSY